jgi:DnaJ-domain-containing protein 1
MLSVSNSFVVAPTPTLFSGSSHTASSRVRFQPPNAFASTASYTSTENATSSYLSRSGMASCSSLYEILGIPSGASCQEIKSAYRRLARVCHPDVANFDRKDSSANDFMKIHAAYSTLSDPAKRADYDRKYLRRHRPLTTASGFSGYTSRNWETDQCW